MKSFIVHDKAGTILRMGGCQNSTFEAQAKNEDELVMEGTANDLTQKIVGKGESRKVVDKTPDEIEEARIKPVVIPEDQEMMQITKKQWREVMDRFDALEEK